MPVSTIIYVLHLSCYFYQQLAILLTLHVYDYRYVINDGAVILFPLRYVNLSHLFLFAFYLLSDFFSCFYIALIYLMMYSIKHDVFKTTQPSFLLLFTDMSKTAT